jgi:MFS transporter, DHA2 family, methylenomycin A resistance protein
MELPQSPTLPLATVQTAPSRLWTAGVIVAVSLGFVMAMLDVTVVNVALGDIQKEFRTSLSTLVWTIDAYTLTFAALLLFGGALADRIGAKRAYMFGLLWFVVASGLCGAAQSGPALIYARLFQGVGAALFMPSSLSLLTQSFPDPVVRTRLLGLWGAIVAAAAGSGSLVGGILVSEFGWRSIFHLNLPIGIVGIVLTALVLKPSPLRHHPFDILTHALIMTALAGLSYALIEGPSLGWLSVRIIAAALIAVVAGTTVFLRERVARVAGHPVIPHLLAYNRRFWVLNLMGFAINFVLFGEIFVISMFLQRARGASAFATGLHMLPMMCMLSIMNLFSGFLCVRWGIRKVILIGILATAAGCLLTPIFGNDSSIWPLTLSVALCNAGLGLAIPAMINGVMHEAGGNEANVGAATLNANRQIGALAGVAAIGIVLHLSTNWSVTLGFVFIGFAACLLTSLFFVRRVLGAAGVSARAS